jgi:hypothetical protein
MAIILCSVCGSNKIRETETTINCMECGDVLQKEFDDIIYPFVPKQWSNHIKIEDWAVNSGWVKKEVLLKWVETNNPSLSELKGYLK